MDDIAKELKRKHPILMKFNVETIHFLLNQNKGIMKQKKGDILFESEDE